MQIFIWDNFVGIDGFEFIEYMVLDLKVFGYLFEWMGFIVIVCYCYKDVMVYCQGDINFIINVEFDLFV